MPLSPCRMPDDLGRELVDLLRVQGPEQRAEAVEQRGQAQRGGGLADRDGRARAASARRESSPGQRQEPLAEQVGVPHDRVGRRGQCLVAVGGELDLARGSRPEADHGHRADDDAGHPHRIAGVQAGHVGEDRVIGVLVADACRAPSEHDQPSKPVTTKTASLSPLARANRGCVIASPSSCRAPAAPTSRSMAAGHATAGATGDRADQRPHRRDLVRIAGCGRDFRRRSHPGPGETPLGQRGGSGSRQLDRVRARDSAGTALGCT